ncbi:hypothetical protein B296_00004955 [Ensete ventricosum]|uniref:Uncharacterized protein n=1 Tax=Ensete ventricosum TaxID=4639 RepID=A0A427B6C1_ENSVE|nr:hypothetical protein B296_00004955 [Ensete ventricosum]
MHPTDHRRIKWLRRDHSEITQMCKKSGERDLNRVVGADVVLIHGLEPPDVVVGVGYDVDVELVSDDPLRGVVGDILGLRQRPQRDQEQGGNPRAVVRMIDRHGFRRGATESSYLRERAYGGE